VTDREQKFVRKAAKKAAARPGPRADKADCEALDPAAPKVHSLPVLLARGPQPPLYQIVLVSNKLPGSECRPKSYPATALFPNSWRAV